MVVTRKQPVAPAPPVSRTSSSQPIPSRRSTTRQTNGVDPKPKVPKDKGKRLVSPSSRKTTVKKPPHRKHNSLVDRAFLLLLTFFAIYAATVCRTQSPVTPESPLICRSLSTYRTAVLEPYVLPPIKAVITHPVVRHSYQTRIQPILHAAQPYLSSAVKAETRVRPYLVRVYTLSQRTIGKTWNGLLKPYYAKAVLPRYRLYILPQIKKYTKPAEAWYRAIVKPYLLQIQGSYKATKDTVHELYLTSIYPYAGKAWSNTRVALCFTYKKARPFLVTVYTYSRKAGCVVWKKSRPAVCATWKQATVYLKYGVHEFGNARRTYVDPHVRRIWEKVSPESTEAQVVVSVPVTTPKTEERITRVDEYPDTLEVETAESLFEPTHSTSSSLPTPTLSSVQTATYAKSQAAPEETPLDEVTIAPIHATPIPEEEVAISVAEASAGGPDSQPSGPAAELEKEVIQSILGNVAKDEITTTASPTPVVASKNAETPSPSPIVEEEASPAEPEETPVLAPAIPEDEFVTVPHSVVAPEETNKHPDLLSASSIIHASAHGILPTVAAAEVNNAEEEIDDFLREIGIHDNGESVQEPVSVSQDTPAEPEQPHQPTPEEIAAKAAQVVAKRADIVGRHEKWQGELGALVLSKEIDLRAVITFIREAAILELNTLSGKTKGGKGVLGGVQTEGERLVKGVEAYLRKAEGRSNGWKLLGEEGKGKERKQEKQLKAQGEMLKFSQVLEKVEGRFEEVVKGMQGEVHEWYVSVRDKEVQEVLEAAGEVKMFAEKAQADIGLDYAWLDDVTYDDWQKYHDLMRASDRFEQTARQVQNNTHPTSPTPDPLLPALDKLQEELGDVVLGFQVALGGAKSRARDVFSVYDSQDDKEDSGFFSIKHGEKESRRVDDMREVLKDKEEEVRILPIEPSPAMGKPAHKEEVVDMAQVVLGKSAEQVEQALKDVPLVQLHEEL